MRFWERLFPHTSYLEKEVDRLRAENKLLLDRILFITTGQGITPETSAPPLTEEQRAAIREKIDDISNPTPWGGKYPTFAEMLQDVESQTFRESADREVGEEIQPGAELENAVEDSSEDDQRRVQILRKHAQIAAANAEAEYRMNQQPVEEVNR